MHGIFMRIKGDGGKFACKGDKPRHNRCIRLTDKCWAFLEDCARREAYSRADFLEECAESNFRNLDIDYSGDSIKDEIIANIRKVAESLESGNKPLIPLKDRRHRAPGREVLKGLISYLESMQ